MLGHASATRSCKDISKPCRDTGPWQCTTDEPAYLPGQRSKGCPGTMEWVSSEYLAERFVCDEHFNPAVLGTKLPQRHEGAGGSHAADS